MKKALRSLLNDMETIWDEHGELTDTVIRDEMREALERSFFAPTEGYALPDEYGMDSPEGNSKVKAALLKFVRAATTEATEGGLSTREDRLRAFQDGEVLSPSGYPYDEFFGYDDSVERA
jgi:hypothetical protein